MFGRTRKLLVPVLGLAVATVLVLSRVKPRVTMHRDDWQDGRIPMPGRRFRSLSHAAHHFRELLSVSSLLGRIYVLRALDPAFREQIMILTALNNGCPT